MQNYSTCTQYKPLPYWMVYGFVNCQLKSLKIPWRGKLKPLYANQINTCNKSAGAVIKGNNSTTIMFHMSFLVIIDLNALTFNAFRILQIESTYNNSYIKCNVICYLICKIWKLLFSFWKISIRKLQIIKLNSSQNNRPFNYHMIRNDFIELASPKVLI